MSLDNSLEVNCPKCTVLNKIPGDQLDRINYCMVCNNLIYQPDDEIVQQISEADKSEKVITENYLKAYQEIPSSFIPASMIHLNAKIISNGNRVDVKFLIDTGAQVSLLPLDIVKACNLENILDQRYSGNLRGVGKDRVRGKLHYVEVEVPCGIIPCSFTVCENSNIEPILGIDMMQQMGLTLDFKSRTIKINDHTITMQ